jgi:hypothetical protein
MGEEAKKPSYTILYNPILRREAKKPSYTNLYYPIPSYTKARRREARRGYFLEKKYTFLF